MATPNEIYDNIRAQVNETDPDFWGETEIYSYMWYAECEIAGLIGPVEETDTSTTTTASTQEYAKPSGCLTIRRVTWNGVKLKRIDFEQQDIQDGVSYGSSTSEGNVHSYYEWGSNIGLYPIPDAAQTLKFWYLGQPTQLTASSTVFSVPELFHHYIPDYALFRMYSKDKIWELANFHEKLWQSNLAKSYEKWKKSRALDRHAIVRDEDLYAGTDLGMI